MKPEEHDELERRLAERITPEFLSTLAEAARVCGWSRDYVEIGTFVEDMFRLADTEPPDLEPYHIEDESTESVREASDARDDD
jgi:hypothetical protein